jgi:hypothetical protein
LSTLLSLAVVAVLVAVVAQVVLEQVLGLL